ncbi:carbohydrate esterase family 16 protein [Gelatoporia subvermispora B]|uniref:Carbohydrate esterase family 16 protein n=1 Tax=Ceriporiopsis subvermispora (strain B) TaxID=914234 RepID=M2PC64_CERS8|nr:carbohydrate esterase family 16 protein [Gelatoporia subvermispora B]
MLSRFAVSISLSTFVAVSFAQQTEWQQCGGIGWTGGTTCASGTVCTEQNAYYSQCLPGAAAPSSTKVPVQSTSSAPSSAPTAAANANYWFSFGDSYTQTQFDINSTQPSPGNPFGNPPYPGYTAVGGVNWIDVDTVVYNKSLILTYNYAYGGATINASLVQPYETTVLSFVDQVNQFMSTVADKPASAPWTSENSLFSAWFGINDIGNSYYEPGNRSAFNDVLLDNYFSLVEDLYNVGARNFLFNNVPPVNRSPLMTPQGATVCATEAAVIADFNSKLASRAAELESAHSGVQTWVWDANTAFSIVLDDPQAYGFVDNTSYGNTGDFWGNNLHPSSQAQTLWGQDVAELLSDTVW